MMTTVTFNVQIIDNCPTTTFSITPNSNQNYNIHDPTLIINLNSFTSPRTYCGTFTYTLVNNDNTAIDTTLFTTSLTSSPL